MEIESEIEEWYRDKDVFVTGATGFMGKVLVAKLLRSCPGVGTIYVLIREKRGVLPKDRLEKMMSCGAFDQVRGEWKERLFPIPGDVSQPGLGISDEHRRLLQETVSVVFHLAATVRFDEPLRIAVSMNIEGTRALMQLCLGMTRLDAVVHVSTAYANCNLSMIEERIYPPPADLGEFTRRVDEADDELLELLTPSLIRSHPNTYTFTKALAENLVEGYSSELPITVVRPSIVSASWREPSPGWIDNYNGTTGMVVGAGKGLFTLVYGNESLIADLMPVDVCINLIIAAGWKVGIRGGSTSERRLVVYNCVSGPMKPISWQEYARVIHDCIRKYPFGEFLTIPGLRPTESRLKFELSYVLEHALPATIADTGVLLSGGVPKFRSYQRQLKKMGSLVDFFTTHEFQFEANNVERLRRRLNSTDQAIFEFDMNRMDWEEYITSFVLGIRRHLIKEKDDTIDKFRRRVAILLWLKRALQISILASVAIGCIYTAL